MNGQEFLKIGERMQARWWSFPIPPSALDQYGIDLADLDAGAVQTAIDSLAADGAERPPTSGQIRRRVAELELDAPTWDVAKTALMRWRHARPARHEAISRWTCPAGQCNGSGLVEIEAWEPGSAATTADCECRPARTSALRGLHELPLLLAEFIDSDHVEPSELDKFLDDGDRTAEAQVRDRLRAFVERAVSSRVLGQLPNPAGLPRLEAARDEDRSRATGEYRRGLRRFDPAGMLPPPAGEVAA